MSKEEQLGCDTRQHPAQALFLPRHIILHVSHGTRPKLSRQFKSPGEIKTFFPGILKHSNSPQPCVSTTL